MTRDEAFARIRKSHAAMRFAVESMNGVYVLTSPEGKAALDAYRTVAMIHADEMNKAVRSLVAQ